MLKTVLHAFNYDLRNAEEKTAWLALKEKLKGGPRRMHALDTGGKSSFYWPGLDGTAVELETAHLFDNQWNTGPIPGHNETGLRVFDFATDALWNNGRENKHIKRGHWLEQTEAMREIRANTLKCGYCGHAQRVEAAPTFCDRCLDSEYLEQANLKMLRLRPIATPFGTDYPALTELEAQWLVPKWVEAQTRGTSKRAATRRAAEREKLEHEYTQALMRASAKHDGMIWLWDHNVNTDNVIYYDHKGIFSFGWRKPLEGPILNALLDIISEFRFPYEIKTAKNTMHEGRTLSGNIE